MDYFSPLFPLKMELIESEKLEVEVIESVVSESFGQGWFSVSHNIHIAIDMRTKELQIKTQVSITDGGTLAITFYNSHDLSKHVGWLSLDLKRGEKPIFRSSCLVAVLERTTVGNEEWTIARHDGELQLHVQHSDGMPFVYNMLEECRIEQDRLLWSQDVTHVSFGKENDAMIMDTASVYFRPVGKFNAMLGTVTRLTRQCIHFGENWEKIHLEFSTNS